MSGFRLGNEHAQSHSDEGTAKTDCIRCAKYWKVAKSIRNEFMRDRSQLTDSVGRIEPVVAQCRHADFQ